MDQYSLWRRTLRLQGDNLDPQREILRQSFLDFRDRARHLVSEIAGLLPDLTVHDITHLDALWRIADQIAGSDYPINPAEAFVLGGAFLLHDAAHVLVAYEDRIQGVKASIEWKDLIAQQFGGIEPSSDSSEERFALFQVLRHLHATQAHNLPKISWQVPATAERLHLISNFQLREYYGDLIGEIAESHHWPAQRLADEFGERIVSAPGFLAPANWEVDALKVAFLLRTSDAAHIDEQRAPWFLFALRQPQGISDSHWRFQAKMGQPTLTSDGELRLSSGSPFLLHERKAWWLAFDTAQLIDRELGDAKLIMRECERKQFAACGVAHVATPASFATHVRTYGWEPVHVAPAIRNVSKVITNFGGTKLYGDKPELALRELIQNAVDATAASRIIGQLGALEGEIEVALEIKDGQCWLHITDQGVGMSKYVLTEVLPDFGNSLWGSESIRSEIPGLLSKGFQSIGHFGIGFYSVFMLGAQVKVTTRRYRKAAGDASDQWVLDFENRLVDRPTLRKPKVEEELPRAGTRISVAIAENNLKKLVRSDADFWGIEGLPPFGSAENTSQKVKFFNLKLAVANLCPTLDIKVLVRVGAYAPELVVSPNDWETISAKQLIERLSFADSQFRSKSDHKLLDLREPDGKLSGRIGYRRYFFDRGHITHKGVRTGTISELSGIVLGYNNADLARSNATPIASHEAWESWATRWIDETEYPHIRMMTTLHPLCATKDLPVYETADEWYTEATMLVWLQTLHEVKVHLGEVTHEDSDDMSESNFNDYFDLASDILIIPSTSKSLCLAVGLQPIDYQIRFEQILSNAWGSFETEPDHFTTVGDVRGEEIVRSVNIYRRTDSIDTD